MSEPLAPLAAPPALAAFLKGVERRAAVLAELQAGEAGIGDAALTRAMAAFPAIALARPMADWPRLFWSALLQQPALRRARQAAWPADLPPAATAPGLRAALLLRVVAGLEEAEAAAVLDVAPGTLRRALEVVVPRAPDGRPDAASWARQRQALQLRVRELPTARALRLARSREAALAGRADRFFPAPHRPPLRALAAVAAGVGLALGATWWLERRVDDRIDLAGLAPAGEPASRYSATAGLVAHPDFALLADPDGERLAQDLAFLSWSAARADAAAAPVDPLAPRPSAADALVPLAAEGESAGAP